MIQLIWSYFFPVSLGSATGHAIRGAAAMDKSSHSIDVDGSEFVETMCEAVRARKRLKLVDKRGKIYGLSDFRLLEVHAVGYAPGGFLVARVWEVANYAIDRSESRWELLRLSNVVDCKLVDEHSKAPRPGYRRDDPSFKEILCQT